MPSSHGVFAPVEPARGAEYLNELWRLIVRAASVATGRNPFARAEQSAAWRRMTFVIADR